MMCYIGNHWLDKANLGLYEFYIQQSYANIRVSLELKLCSLNQAYNSLMSVVSELVQSVQSQVMS